MLTKNLVHVFAMSRQLMALTRHYILEHDYSHARQCFLLAEKWLREGSPLQKIAVTNDFMFSMSMLIDRLGKERQRILALLPPLLQREYLCQINALSV